MQILTKQIFTYNVQGTVPAFSSYLHHKSHYTEKKTMKLWFFLKDSNGIIDSGNGDECVTRNDRVKKQHGDKEFFKMEFTWRNDKSKDRGAKQSITYNGTCHTQLFRVWYRRKENRRRQKVNRKKQCFHWRRIWNRGQYE